jgi:hypothetical protein
MDILDYSIRQELTKPQQECVVALSDLFLNAPIEDDDLDHIAKKLEYTGLQWDEIEDIFWNDTFYVLIPNLIRHDGTPWPWTEHQWIIDEINQHRGIAHKRFMKFFVNRLLKLLVGEGMEPRLQALQIK